MFDAADLQRRLNHLENWRDTMDAQVVLLQQNYVALQADVAAVAQEVSDLQKGLAAGIDAEDETAIVAVNSGLVNLHAALVALAVKSPTGGTGPATGATGA